MSQLPTAETIKSTQELAAKQLADKIASQQAEGKGFSIDASGHSAGVVPEASWQDKKRLGETQ